MNKLRKICTVVGMFVAVVLCGMNAGAVQNTVLPEKEKADDEIENYIASDYISYEGELPAFSFEYDDEEIYDFEVEEELKNRAYEAGVDISAGITDEDVMAISDQEYQTVEEYKAFLKEIISEKKAYRAKDDALYEYMEMIVEDSQMTGDPEELLEYYNSRIDMEKQMKNSMLMLGFSIDTLDELDDEALDNIRSSILERNEEALYINMYLRFILERNNITVEPDDYEKMIDFYRRIQGVEYVEEMEAMAFELELEDMVMEYKLNCEF